ncbi:rhotekin-like, partial [Empidonax traillii]|uniref:rhotekin-like n=1 Tax=Empidonax traillii TaxID=164674 RepID=UPI000FFD19F6
PPDPPLLWQEPELQRALERALRVREGARRLLPACSRPEQALETTKTLVLCDARVVAAGGELQRRQEARLRGARRPLDAGPGAERVPCRGTVCISDLRIPLMWKDTEYFRNKGELHRCAVFLLLQVGAEIHDTPTVLVDRTLTDICFEGAVLLDCGVQTLCPPQDTRVRAEPGGRGKPPVVSVTNRLGGEEVTHALVAESTAEAQRWLEAFKQHLYDLGQWKQCCEELMRIEEPPPRRPPAPLPPQGSLYHQTAIDPSDDIAAVTDILTRHRGGPRSPGPPPWLSLFEGPPLRSPSPPRRGRPRTLSLDARLSTLKGRGGTPRPPHSSSSSSGSSSPGPPQRDPPRPLQSRV